MLNPIERLLRKLSTRSARALWLCVFAIYVHCFLEWLFFVTKPSYFALLTLQERLAAMAGAPLPFLAVLLPAALVGIALAAAFSRAAGARLNSFLVNAVPSFLIACVLLILIDNFTYTVFGFGITSLQNAARLMYAALFLGLFAGIQLWLLKREANSRATAAFGYAPTSSGFRWSRHLSSHSSPARRA